MNTDPITSVRIPTIWGHTDVHFYNNHLTINRKDVPYASIRNYSLAQTGWRINFVPTATSFKLHIQTNTDTHDLFWGTPPFNAGGKIRLQVLQQLSDALQRYALPQIINALLDLHKRGKPLEFKRIVLEPQGIRLKNSWAPSGEFVHYNTAHFEKHQEELRIKTGTENGNDGFIINFLGESTVLPILLNALIEINT